MCVGHAQQPRGQVSCPALRTLDDPTVFIETAPVFGTTSGDHRLDTSFAQFVSVRIGIVATIGIDGTWLLQGTAACAPDRRDGVDQRQKLRDIVPIGSGQACCDWDTVGIGGDAVLRTRSRAIVRVFSFSHASTARIDNESTTTREKSIYSAKRSCASSNSCSCDQTPAACQSCKRRQQLTPEPDPISAGRSRYRSPDLSTKMMPVNAARPAIGLRPGCFVCRDFHAGNSVRSVSTIRRQ